MPAIRYNKLVKRYGLLLLTGGLLAAFYAFCPKSQPNRPSPLLAQPAPGFRLSDAAGQLVSLSDYKGKVVLLNFWATWCDSCQQEMPALETIYRHYRPQGFTILAPSVDEAGRKAVIPFAARYGLSFPILIADVNTAKTYQIFGLPTSYLLDVQGRIARKYVGPIEPKVLENDILEQLKFRRPS